jgi:hypothetical protein
MHLGSSCTMALNYLQVDGIQVIMSSLGQACEIITVFKNHYHFSQKMS